jgi:hypothetical protein
MGITISNDLNYPVRIDLDIDKFMSIMAVEKLHNQLGPIIKWCDEQTDWQPKHYEYRFLPNSGQLEIWFKNEKDAMMCILKWS